MGSRAPTRREIMGGRPLPQIGPFKFKLDIKFKLCNNLSMIETTKTAVDDLHDALLIVMRCRAWTLPGSIANGKLAQVENFLTDRIIEEEDANEN
jgi:hypothetical protein